VVELDGAGHWPHEEAPERVIAELRRFLSGA
jgi:pimeloyl-ACP methyl ester carboxylesterase